MGVVTGMAAGKVIGDVVTVVRGVTEGETIGQVATVVHVRGDMVEGEATRELAMVVREILA